MVAVNMIWRVILHNHTRPLLNFINGGSNLPHCTYGIRNTYLRYIGIASLHPNPASVLTRNILTVRRHRYLRNRTHQSMQACVAVHHLPYWEPDDWDRRIIVAVPKVCFPQPHSGFEWAATPPAPHVCFPHYRYKASVRSHSRS